MESLLNGKLYDQGEAHRRQSEAKWALSVCVSLTEWDVAAERTSEDIWVALLQIRLPLLSHFPSNYQRNLKSIGDYSVSGKVRDFAGSLGHDAHQRRIPFACLNRIHYSHNINKIIKEQGGKDAFIKLQGTPLPQKPNLLQLPYL